MNPQIVVFTIADLRDWLIDNKDNGISEYVIDPCRAFAWINNPCALDADPALVVVYDENHCPIGYTGAFAEDCAEGNIQGRIFWGSTEWIEPAYRGKGIAATMMHTIKETVGYDNYFASDSSEASVRLDMKQGSRVQYFQRIRYKLSSKESFKSRCMSFYTACSNIKSLNKIKRKNSFTNQYITCVDGETYGFIKSHSDNDLFLRKQEMLNWMLHYPFMKSVGEDGRSEKDLCEFGSSVSHYSIEAVKVSLDGVLIGVYIVSQTDKTRTLRYVYYEEEYKDNVFASVAANLLKKGTQEIRFFSTPLHQYMVNHSIMRLNKKSIYNQVAFTTPNGFVFDNTLCLQGGDGDMFC